MVLRIGSSGGVRPSARPLQYSRQSASAADLGGAVGSALQGLGISVDSYAKFKKQKQDQEEDNGTALNLSRSMGEAERELEELRRTAPEDAAGFTEQAEALLRGRLAPVLEGITDPTRRARYEAQIEGIVQGGTTAAFQFEYERGNAAFVRTTGDRLSEAQTRIYDNPDLLDEELADLEAVIRGSTLSEPEKEALVDEVYAGVASVAYQRSLESALESNTPQGDPATAAVVAPGTSSRQAGVLSSISGVESSGDYGVINGGKQITDYSDHPRDHSSGSSAAGKYQFIEKTWDWMVDLLASEGTIIPDFSPVSQDRVALRYAQHTWDNSRHNNGMSFDEAINSNDRATLLAVRDALRGESWDTAVWQGLWNVGDDEWIAQVASGQATGGSAEGIPDPIHDPRFADLPFDLRLQMHGQAQTAVAERRRAAAQAESDAQRALHTSLATSLQNNEPGAMQRIDEALQSGQISNIELRDDLFRRTADTREANASNARVASGIQAGTTFTSEDEDPVMAYMDQQGITAGLAAGDAASAERFVRDAAAMSYVPAPILSSLMAQMGSANASSAAFAAQTLTQLYRQAPGAFSQYATEEQLADVVAMTLIDDTSETGAEMASRTRFMTDPAMAPERKILREQAQEALADFTPGDLAARLDTSRVPGNPALPADPVASRRLSSQYRGLYEEGFVRFGGDDAKAREFAQAMILQNWSPDPFSGALMEFSPLSPRANVVELSGGKEWIDGMIRERFDLAEDDIVTLIPDAQTKQEIASGQTPRYIVATMSADGLRMEFPAGAERIAIEPSEAQVQRSRYDTEVQRLEVRLRNLETTMRPTGGGGVRGGQRLESGDMGEPAEITATRRRLESLRARGPGGLEEASPPRPTARPADATGTAEAATPIAPDNALGRAAFVATTPEAKAEFEALARDRATISDDEFYRRLGAVFSELPRGPDRDAIREMLRTAFREEE